MNKLLDEPQRSCLDILAKTKKLLFVLEVATRLLDGQARDLTAVIYARIFKFLKHEYMCTGCPRRNVPDFGTVFLMLKYTDINQNTYIQS